MSDQGLSIFDDDSNSASKETSATEDTQVLPRVTAAVPEAVQLPVVRRGGYDTAAVDAHVRRLTEANSANAAALESAKGRIAQLEQDLARVKAELAENSTPSYASLGGRANALLRIAEEEAGEIKVAAERDAADIRAQAAKDTQAMRAEAQRELAELRNAQHQELDEQRARFTSEAESERNLARSEADDLLSSAKREADQIRLAAEQEINEMRTAAQREVEQARAGADREVQEARRMLAVEKERLAREATDHHNSAVAETKRLVAEAEQRAHAAEERARIASQQITDQRAAAKTESESLLARAKREAEQLVSAARAQAETITSAGNAEAERELGIVKAEVARMVKRRDAITAQLASLSELVAGFGKDDVEDEEPVADEATQGEEPA